MSALLEKEREPLEVVSIKKYSKVTISFADAAKEPLYCVSSSVENRFDARVSAKGTEGPPPPPPPHEAKKIQSVKSLRKCI